MGREIPALRSTSVFVTWALGITLAAAAGASELFFDFDVTAERIAESAADDLAEICRELPGASAVRRGAIDLEPALRGLREEQLGTFVDGSHAFAASPARLDSSLSHVNPHAVERLKIVRGPYALTWGPGTLSALEVETFAPPLGSDDVRGTFDLSFGSNARDVDAFGNVWHGHDRWTWVLEFARRSGHDYEAGDGSEVPADFASNTFRSYWAIELPLDVLVTFHWNYQEQLGLDDPGSLFDTTYAFSRSHAVDLTWSGRGVVSEVHGQLYSHHRDHRMNGDEKPTPFLVDLPAESNTAGGRLRVALAMKRLSATLGLDYYELRQNATRTVSSRDDGALVARDVVWPDATIEDLGGYAQLAWRAGCARFAATVRIDGVDAAAGEPSAFFLANAGGDVDRSDTHVSAALAASVDLGSRWTLSAGVGRAVRAATVDERYSDRFPAARLPIAAEVVGDPRLDPERSLEWNIGLRGRWGGFLLEVGGFHRTIDGYVTVVPALGLPPRLPSSFPGVYRYAGGGRATFTGGELFLSQRVVPRFSWRGTLSWTRGDDEELGEPVLGVAPLRGELGLRVHALADRFWLDLATRFAARQDRVAASRFERETPGCAVYDLTARLALASGWTFRVGVLNVTDKAYSDHLNAPDPFTGRRVPKIGRSFRIGLGLRFSKKPPRFGKKRKESSGLPAGAR